MAEPMARTEMLVRRPAADVFDAFVRPDMITRFWLESTTGPLAPGARVEWRFMVPGAVENVAVTAFEERSRIAFDWSGGIRVNMSFREENAAATRVAVEVAGFSGADVVEQVVGATEGFSIVLCDLKALLETGRSGNFVRDKAEMIARS